jgi:hypothetical protein
MLKKSTNSIIKQVDALFNDLGEEYCCDDNLADITFTVSKILGAFDTATCYTKKPFESAGASSLEGLLDEYREVVKHINDFSGFYNLIKESMNQAVIRLGDYKALLKNNIFQETKGIPKLKFDKKKGIKLDVVSVRLPETKDDPVVGLLNVELSFANGLDFSALVADLVDGCRDSLINLIEGPIPCCGDSRTCSASDDIILRDQTYCSVASQRVGTLSLQGGNLVKAGDASCFEEKAAKSMRIVGPAPAGLFI